MAPLIVIVGETASGKSALAMDLACQFNGEIICADSRTIYKGMDIGTAKPSLSDQKEIKHHGLDVVDPNQTYTVSEFKDLANTAISEINAKGKLAIMVGGSGLYVDALLYDYQFSEPGAERDPLNPRHLKTPTNTSKVMRSNTLVLGMTIEKEVLKERVENRVDLMLKDGLENEVASLVDRYGWDAPAMNGVGYREFKDLFNGTQNITETRNRIIQSTMNLAKKQRTWFKRNSSIQWYSDPKKIVEIVTTFLNNNK